MAWLDKLLGRTQQPAQPCSDVADPPDDATLDELIEANLELGRRQDAIRERRVAIRRRIDLMHELRDAPPDGPED